MPCLRLSTRLEGTGVRRLVDGGSLVYLTARRLESGDGVRWDLGAIGHGPAAAELTEHLCDEARAWSSKRDQYEPKLVIYPAGTPQGGVKVVT